MLLTVKKQVEETVELKTPAYYKGVTGVHYINENGQLIYANISLVLTWAPSDGEPYINEVRSMMEYSKPCTKEEFHKAYDAVMAKFESVFAATVINS